MSKVETTHTIVKVVGKHTVVRYERSDRKSRRYYIAEWSEYYHNYQINTSDGGYNHGRSLESAFEVGGVITYPTMIDACRSNGVAVL
jgi:hypothetical protein